MTKMTRRIGIHLGTTGGASNAVERAREIGANTFQIFSSSPRMWRAPKIDPKQGERMRALRAKLDVGPLVIHTGYLINICSQSHEVREKSVAGFRGETERALALGAEYLVLHPGSWKGLTRDEGLKLAAESIERAIDGLPWQATPFHILIENTAGAEFSLGGNFEQVAELVARLKHHAPVAVCLDTCHTWVSGYDLVSAEGYTETMNRDLRGSPRVALQRCQGRARFQARPPRAHRAGNSGSRAVSSAAERCALRSRRVYRRDARGRTRRRATKRARTQEPGEAIGKEPHCFRLH